MKVCLIAPSPVPFVIGGAENLWQGLLEALNARPGIEADLIKLPCPERNFSEIIRSYRAFSALDLSHFDCVISTKYPAWMVGHPCHLVYVQHKLRGLYDTYPVGLSREIPADWRLPRDLRRLLSDPEHRRDQLESLFDSLEECLEQAANYPSAWFALPGPLLRAVVHKLDAIALAPDSIRRYYAISQTVARREDHFPAGEVVRVIHHPTNLHGLHSGPGKAIFTASRLDSAKRVDLLVRAYLQSGITAPLRIAGSGPQEPALKQLAQGNSNIVFLGRVTESQLVEEYANALFVPFIPDQEDYGLITLEAMLCAKPVLTTTDAGGVTELVQDGVNGIVVPPDVDALARGLRQLAQDPAKAERLGQKALASVAHINWPELVEALLDFPPSLPKQSRLRILVANTFPIYPPVGGGQQRLYHLYRNLVRMADVTMVTLVPVEALRETIELAPGFVEIRVPRSAALQQQEAELDRGTGISCGDLAAMLYPSEHLEWLYVLRDEAARSGALIATHPYAYPALRAIWRGPIYYEAHNVEYDLKAPFLAGHAELLARLAEVEGECARQAPRIFACSQQDAERLAELYGIEEGRFRVIPNGVDTRLVAYAGPARRKQNKARLGIGQMNLALFMGSDHPPNRDAARLIVGLAQQLPEVLFLIMGSVERALPGKLPANVHALGPIAEAEKLVWLQAADVALNPITSGSGTNLKLLEYAAAGIPILTTPFGARGGILQAEDVWLAEASEFAAAIESILVLGEGDRQAKIRSARQRVEAKADWSIVAGQLASELAADAVVNSVRGAA